MLNELVSTERSYVARLRTLKHAYADPLRKFARKKEEAILPAYEAKTLFGNIDVILPANEAFLADLEVMMTPHGPQSVGGIGDICLRHVGAVTSSTSQTNLTKQMQLFRFVIDEHSIVTSNITLNEKRRRLSLRGR